MPGSQQRQALAAGAERWTGSRTQALELSAAELAFAVDQAEALTSSLRQHARVLMGRQLPSCSVRVGSFDESATGRTDDIVRGGGRPRPAATA